MHDLKDLHHADGTRVNGSHWHYRMIAIASYPAALYVFMWFSLSSFLASLRSIVHMWT